MPFIEEQAASIVATAAEVAKLKALQLETRILGQASASLLRTGSDDFSPVDFFTLVLEIPVAVYASIDNTKSAEEAVRQLVVQVARRYPGNVITEVVIAPRGTSTQPRTSETAQDAPAFWATGYYRLFISHVTAVKKQAHALKSALALYHVAAFVAHDDIEVTKEWQGEIERALRTMDSLAAIISDGFVESRWCDQEVGFAIGQGKLVVPLCVDADPHGFLSKYQAAKIKGQQPAQVADEVFRILIKNRHSSERMSDALVDRMTSSASFDISIKTLKLLKRVGNLNDPQITKLVESIDGNRQVRHAIGVPEGIRALVGSVSEAAAKGKSK